LHSGEGEITFRSLCDALRFNLRVMPFKEENIVGCSRRRRSEKTLIPSKKTTLPMANFPVEFCLNFMAFHHVKNTEKMSCLQHFVHD